MVQIGVRIDDDLAQRLREYTVKKSGSLRGQSEIVKDAIKEYLDKHEKEILKRDRQAQLTIATGSDESGNPLKASTVA